LKNREDDLSQTLRKAVMVALIIIIPCFAGYFLWGEVQFENRLRELDQFCAELKVQTSLTEIQTTIGFSPRLHMILLDQSPDGEQIGSIYFDGSGRWACNVSFAQGRLIKRSYGSHNFASENGAPAERLKPW
jgi:hypothetical protein